MNEETLVQNVTIRRLEAEDAHRHLPPLSVILHACVNVGAGIGFVLPFSQEEADTWWKEDVLPVVADRTRALVIAEVDGAIVATGQLQLDCPDGQCHRAEVMKVLTHPNHRRRGYARAIMAELERIAQEHGKHTLTLETRSGDAAEPLYRSLDYTVERSTSGSCCNAGAGGMEKTTFMYKQINTVAPASISGELK